MPIVYSRGGDYELVLKNVATLRLAVLPVVARSYLYELYQAGVQAILRQAAGMAAMMSLAVRLLIALVSRARSAARPCR